MFSRKCLSGTSTYLEDVILLPPEVLIIVLMARVTFTEPEVSFDVDADADAELRGC